MGRTQRRRRARVAVIATATLTGLVAPAAATTVAAQPEPVPPGEVPFTTVVEDVLAGDLVVAGNSNLLAAGGWRVGRAAAADVDGETRPVCVGRGAVPAVCADNSSSAVLDIPAGARVVAARLYVHTSLSSSAGAVRARLDGPAEGFAYTDLGAETDGIPKLAEGWAPAGRTGGQLRQATWDVTAYVAAAGAGSYTVADIVSERAGAFLPYASWALVAAYELDPVADLATVAPTPEAQQRFATRAISWHDGFVARAGGSIDVVVAGLRVDAGSPVFAKSLHVVAHARHRGFDNLLYDGNPIGNSASLGDPPPPPGVVVGTDLSCNSTLDVLNDSICLLGSPVATKSPGPADYVAAKDGRTTTSGSGVDIDVVRIPARYLRPGSTSATLSLRAPGPDVVAAGVLAVAVDVSVGAVAP